MKIVNFRKLLLFALLFVPVTIIAQVNVKGVVKDEFGDTLPGVNVMIKGTTKGTVTDFDGKFSIEAKSSDVIEVSFVGFETQEIKVGNQTNLSIVLRESSVMIQELEVVAVGYGDVRRKDLTGSVAKANMDDILKTPVNNVAQALGGRIAGVQVSSKDGGLGDNFSITIRGSGSLTQNTQPLYVIDGFPLEASNMGSLNPKDIASIDVLKDASATAIYGSRGANGVVIITTKSGKAGRPKIEYNGSLTVSNVAKEQPLLNGYEFVLLQQELIGEEDFAANYLRNGRTVESYKTEPTYDWQNEVYRTAISQDHYVSLSGKQEDLTYTTSASFTNQEGVIINSNLEKYVGRINLDQKMYDNKLRLRLISSAARTTRNGVDPTGGSNSVSNALMYSIWGFRPVSPTGANLMDEFFDDTIEMTEDYRFNPIHTARNEYRKTTTDNLSINVMADYQIIKGLQLKVTGGYQLVSYTNEIFNNKKTKSGYYHDQNSQYRGVNASFSETKTNRFLNENTLTYQYGKKGHNVNLLGGVTFQKEGAYAHDMLSTFITNEAFGMAGFGKTEAVSTVGASKGENSLMSFLSRVNYNYKSIYYLTATFRRDGSSKFATNNRWGNFPSASLAWAFSREEFMRDLRFMSNGKIRLSYGQTGNNRVGNYAYHGMLYTDNNIFYPFDSNKHTAYYPSQMQNESLKWETTEQYNAGVDLGFLDDRVNLTVDYYLKKTKDLLLQADLAASSGYASTMMNVGQLQNRGVEISLETTNIKSKDFIWSSSFNISFNQNKITKLNDNQIAMTNSVYWDNKFRTMPAYLSPVGQSAGLIYGYLFERTYKEDDFNITQGTNGQNIYTPKEGVVAFSNQSQPGDPKYTDINGDGVINDRDKTVIGRGHPVAIGGLGNTFIYKGFDFNFFFQFNIGNDILNANRMEFENPAGKRHLNMFKDYINRWTVDNPTSNMPRSRATGSKEYSSLYVEDGSFLRLKSASLGYNFPAKILAPLHVSSARLSISADNLFVITNYSGNDPEVSTRHSVLTPGFDWSPYPRARNYSASLSITF